MRISLCSFLFHYFSAHNTMITKPGKWLELTNMNANKAIYTCIAEMCIEI